MQDHPLAIFITWTVYGTFLPGDKRGWRHRSKGEQNMSAGLEQWHAKRLKYKVETLDQDMRSVAECAIQEICNFRSWKLWVSSVRTNHVQFVISSSGYAPQIVRDQVKAKCTRELRKDFAVWKNRPIWSANGDIEFLDSEANVERCVGYVVEAQDRKSLES